MLLHFAEKLYIVIFQSHVSQFSQLRDQLLTLSYKYLSIPSAAVKF